MENINAVVGHSTDKNTLKDICDKQNKCINIDGALFCSGYSNELSVDCFEGSAHTSKLTGQQLFDDTLFRMIEKQPGYYSRYTQIDTSSKGNSADAIGFANIIENLPQSHVIETTANAAAYGSLWSSMSSIFSIAILVWLILSIFK